MSRTAMIYLKTNPMFRLFLFLLFASATFFAQAQDYTQSIKSDVENLKVAFDAKDFNKLTDFTYPSVVEQMGGKELMVQTLETGFQQLQTQGVTFKALEIGEIGKVYEAGDELHALVAQKLEMSVPGGTVKAASYLLAISQNNGKNWYFIDTAQLNGQAIKALLPAFNEDLVIPAKTEPVFIPN